MQINKILIIISCVDSYWVWRSLVARLNGVQEAGSSNLLTQTTFEETDTEVSVFLLCRVRRPFELLETVFLQRKSTDCSVLLFWFGFCLFAADDVFRVQHFVRPVAVGLIEILLIQSLDVGVLV